MGFIDDLKFGNKYELDCISRLKNAKKIDGKFKPYDIIDSDGIKYEVKSDRWTHKTGNICIEYMCNNKSSGITSTEADYYFYYVVGGAVERIYKVPTTDVRDMINNKAYHKVQNGGDGWRSRFYLFKETLFEKYRL